MMKQIMVKDQFTLTNLSYRGENRSALKDQYKTFDELLSAHPRGAYSTGRTVDRDSVLEFPFHVERLTKSYNSIFEENLTKENLSPILMESLRYGVNTFKDTFKESKEEMKLTMFITKETENQTTSLFTLVAPLGLFPDSVNVEIRRAERHNPTVKDSRWIESRKTLEQKKAKDVNEVLLENEDGELLEGTQTNFFALNKEGVLLTAGDDRVLPGTIRNLILHICKEKNIAIKMEAPNVKDINNWDSCFLSSSSRLILPIHEMRLPEVEPAVHHKYDIHPKIIQLQKDLWAKLRSESTKLN
eukprot:TRINITY_DN7784_c0_g1_i1.p1 TRINITY_DN7784_c0_g1~~TRINITY_DN7784_c0_g1_i1.p1  ORF type:complete len:301 (-),score=70.17 TRINITY_DN7784_c0_g1_i1:46-948(-)